MSYCASGSGCVIPKQKVPEKILEPLSYQHAGFIIEESPNGGLWFTYEYNSYNDQIEDGLIALAPYVKFGNIDFIGEDKEMWRFSFDDGKVYYAEGEVTYKNRWEMTRP